MAVAVLVAASLAAGAVAWWASSPRLAHALWVVGGVAGGALSASEVVATLRQRRLGVDLVAVAGLAGAVWVGEYLAGEVIALMVVTGHALEEWAERRSRRDLSALLERAPRRARLYRDGGLVEVDVGEVVAGDRLMVATGELVPVDGALAGPAVLDESTLTGESRPVERAEGELVRSGSANAGTPFDVVARATAAESTYAGIVRLVEAAQRETPPFVRLADRYAAGFLVVTVVTAVAAGAAGGATRAVAVLVVATPCPLILAAPIAWVAGLSRCARRGVVVKSGAVLERLARCTSAILDKTGTLTRGRPELSAVVCAPGVEESEVLTLAASLEQHSSHVLAASVVSAARARGLALTLPEEVVEEPGRGLSGRVGTHRVTLGALGFVGLDDDAEWARPAERAARVEGSLTVGVARDGEVIGVLVAEDPMRPDARRAVRTLRDDGITRVVMASGDRREVAEAVGASLGLDEVFYGMGPADKLDVVRTERERAGVVMVGDGVNDAPALALADVGVAMGARGATASSQAADVVVIVDRLDRVGEARAVAARSRAVALQSVLGGMGASVAAMVAAALGHLSAIEGALLQEVIDLAAISNALRALRGAAPTARLDAPGRLAARRVSREHQRVVEVAREARRLADALGTTEPTAELARLHRVRRDLEEVVAHEAAEEHDLLPSVDRVLGREATAVTMREHVDIAARVRRLGEMVDDLGEGGASETGRGELREALYSLSAVLTLHTEVEEESYVVLGDDDGSGVGGLP
jgi:heavy metal translocating P-type ATPase